MAVTVAIMIGSPRSTLDLVKTSLNTIYENIGTAVHFHIGVISNISPKIEIYLRHFQNKCPNTRIIWNCTQTWAQFINLTITEADSEWFLVSHDDVCLVSKNVIPFVKSSLGTFESKTGWITFTDNDYLNGHWAPSIREGWHIDHIKENAWSRKKIFQFHSLAENWFKPDKNRLYFESLNYDFPSRPVKCHSPFSHFNLINLKTLKQIGLCEQWGDLSLLVDEDWGLEALRHGFFNVWMSSVVYTHRRLANGTRAFRYDTQKEEIEKEAQRKEVHRLFKKKWGFDANVLPSDMKTALKTYEGTNVFWSLDKRSYEWDYI